MQVSQVTSGPRRGPTFNNRWWNDRREWNLRTSIEKEKASPKGANHIQSCFCSPPSRTIGRRVSTIRRFHSLRSFHQRLFTFAPFGDGRRPNNVPILRWDGRQPNNFLSFEGNSTIKTILS